MQSNISISKTSQQAVRISWLSNLRYLLPLVVAFALVVYFLSVIPRLAPAGASQVELIAIGVLFLKGRTRLVPIRGLIHGAGLALSLGGRLGGVGGDARDLQGKGRRGRDDSARANDRRVGAA
jgi:hypothetical protein